MSEYSKLKNAELEAILKQRQLPHTGKKADMIARLQEDDKKKAAAQTAKPAGQNAEDEINWEDDAAETPNPASISAPTTAKSATETVASTATGEAKDETTEHSKVADKAVVSTSSKAPEESKRPSSEEETVQDAADNVEEPTEPKEEKPTTNFAAGYAPTTLEEEIEKRKARAKKFGIPENEDETLRKLERAKRFGEVAAPGKLNEALPERRKRGREAADEGSRGGHNKRRGKRFDGRRGGNRRGGERQNRDSSKDQGGSSSRAGAPTWMSDVDKAKLEARKQRFAGKA